MTPKYDPNFIAVCYNPIPELVNINFRKVRTTNPYSMTDYWFDDGWPEGVYRPKDMEFYESLTVEINNQGDDLWTVTSRGKFERPLKKYKETKEERKARVQALADKYTNKDFEL